MTKIMVGYKKGIFYNPNNTLKRGIYILTIKEKDGENDKSSNLDRENIYRINVGVYKKTFINLFEKVILFQFAP
ncbi:MAG: hypothetical protein HFJ09_03045 [Lachnospiraceae bacterium]|nr:hypothetical protein [Lachnospiraceae bacterium]